MRGPHGEELPDAILFACNLNAVRSPMAAALMSHLYGRLVHVGSCGVRSGDPDPFAIAVMDELGIDLRGHRPRSFAELEETSWDMIISLTPESHHQALELTRTMAVDVEYWPTQNPGLVEGNRERVLEAYRGARDGLLARTKARFSPPVAGERRGGGT